LTFHAFWQEELRSFPYSGRPATLWIVSHQERSEGPGGLRLLLHHAWRDTRWNGDRRGQESRPTSPAPPLARLLRACEEGTPSLLSWSAAERRTASGAAPGGELPPRGRSRPRVESLTTVEAEPAHHLCARPSGAAFQTDSPGPYLVWVESLRVAGSPIGALALWYPADPPWGEAVHLWGVRLARKLEALLRDLPPDHLRAAGMDPGGVVASRQGCLFPARMLETTRAGPLRLGGAGGLLLPRPVFVVGIPGAVGISRELQECGAAVASVAPTDVNVLLQGESGTGKEIIARAVHLGSERREGPFVGQNCAALPEALFESELFGHRAGAFTGASGDKPGLLEAAHGGTFFLDEIGDMPLPLQIKLLRVMQERSVRRIGELESRPVDIRFVAATHKDLEEEIRHGRFRLDLYYRLKVVRLAIPPLRHRPEDIAHLLAYFLRRQGCCRGELPRISEPALAALQAYRWPGNVRELENEVSRLLALHPVLSLVELEQLSVEIQAAAGRSVDAADLGTLRPLEEAAVLLECYLIRKAIAAAGGRKASAARRLGLSRQGLYKKIQRYGMTDLIQHHEELETACGVE
jgi:transcriptional regulator with AAA-type ATPase domain